MKLTSYIVLLGTAFMLPQAAKGVNIWEGTGEEGGPTCNAAEGGCQFGDIVKVIANIFSFLIAVAIPITVGMIVFGAVQLIISRGSPEKMKNAKSTMFKAVVGFVIVLAAYLIVKTIESVLKSGASAPPAA